MNQPQTEISKTFIEKIQECFKNVKLNIEMNKVADFTTNLSEFYHSIRAKLDHGKFRNYIQGGSFQIRSYCAALIFNEGYKWVIQYL